MSISKYLNNFALTRRGFLSGAVGLGAAAALAPARSEAAAGSGLNVGIIGLGSQGRRDLYALMSLKANIVALCDVDERQIAHLRREAGLKHARAYTDYRTMLAKERGLHAVVVATPDHWHALLCRAALHAGKHVYCEKPLARTVGETRALRELARSSRLATQMGNQGSASNGFRRSVEVIQAGALGDIREVHVYIPGGRFPRGINRPRRGGAAAPHGLNWDFWLGPAPAQPYHAHLYHPFDWRGWYDFGSGQLGDFGCHALNLPVRALDLPAPEQIEVMGNGFGRQSYILNGEIRLSFPAREGKCATKITWYEETKPPLDVYHDVIDFYGEIPSGVLLRGDNGQMVTSPHNMSCIVKLRRDDDFHPVMQHEGLRSVPQTLPRVRSHMDEWVNACKMRGGTYSGFDTGGHLTEIVQAGVLALRLGRDITWNGETMEVEGAPEAAALVTPYYRTRWMA